MDREPHLPGGGRRVVSDGAWWTGLAGGLAALVGVLAWLRFGGRSWLAAISPGATRLLDGHIVVYESAFHFPLLSTMNLGAAAGYDAMESHDYRIWLLVYLASASYAWLGSAFWAYALVDLGGWWLGAVATAGLGRRLGATRREATLAALLAAASPAGVGWMWTHTLHVAASAAIAPLAWLGLVAVDQVGPKGSVHLRRATAVATTLLAGSLTYQHHFMLIPLLLGWAARSRRGDASARVAGVAAGAALFVIITVALRWVLARQGTPVLASDNDPVYFIGDVLRRSLDAARTDGFLAGLTFAPGRAPGILAACFGLPALLLGLGGLVWAAMDHRRASLGWLGLLGMSMTAAEVAVVPRIYVGLEGYPFVALGTAIALFGLWKRGAAQWACGARRQPLAARAVGALVCVPTVVAALVAVAVTNADLWGDYSFAIRWFGSHWR